MKNKTLIATFIAVITFIAGCDSLWQVSETSDIRLSVDTRAFHNARIFSNIIQNTASEYSNKSTITISLHNAQDDSVIDSKFENLTDSDQEVTVEFKDMPIVGKTIYAKAVFKSDSITKEGRSNSKRMVRGANALFINGFDDNGHTGDNGNTGGNGNAGDQGDGTGITGIPINEYNFYVSSSGDDTNIENGRSPYTPYKTIQKALEVIKLHNLSRIDSGKQPSEYTIHIMSDIINSSAIDISNGDDTELHITIQSIRGSASRLKGVIIYDGHSLPKERVMNISGENVHVTLKNITITQGGAEYGSGIYVGNKAHLVIDEGAIITENNYLKTNGGGVYIDTEASVHMKAGEITNNDTAYYATSGSVGIGLGGGVYVAATGTFTFEGGIISGNRTLVGSSGINSNGLYVAKDGNYYPHPLKDIGYSALYGNTYISFPLNSLSVSGNLYISKNGSVESIVLGHGAKVCIGESLLTETAMKIQHYEYNDQYYKYDVDVVLAVGDYEISDEDFAKFELADGTRSERTLVLSSDRKKITSEFN